MPGRRFYNTICKGGERGRGGGQGGGGGRGAAAATKRCAPGDPSLPLCDARFVAMRRFSGRSGDVTPRMYVHTCVYYVHVYGYVILLSQPTTSDDIIGF